jgi:hypothetical protein
MSFERIALRPCLWSDSKTSNEVASFSAGLAIFFGRGLSRSLVVVLVGVLNGNLIEVFIAYYVVANFAYYVDGIIAYYVNGIVRGFLVGVMVVQMVSICGS